MSTNWYALCKEELSLSSISSFAVKRREFYEVFFNFVCFLGIWWVSSESISETLLGGMVLL